MLCGGDVNKLDIKCFEEMFGWNVLVNFFIRGNFCLDNCFMNCMDFFLKCYFFYMFFKMDYMGVILLFGIKFLFICCKVYVCD